MIKFCLLHKQSSKCAPPKVCHSHVKTKTLGPHQMNNLRIRCVENYAIQ
jgi:hypothetical protein